MSVGEREALCDEARRWLRHAAEDERVVGLALAAEPPLPGPAAYHAQQVAEKCLKALLVLRARPVPRTHDVAHLPSLTGYPPGFDRMRTEQIASLTPWASHTSGRYSRPLVSAFSCPQTPGANLRFAWAPCRRHAFGVTPDYRRAAFAASARVKNACRWYQTRYPDLDDPGGLTVLEIEAVLQLLRLLLHNITQLLDTPAA